MSKHCESSRAFALATAVMLLTAGLGRPTAASYITIGTYDGGSADPFGTEALGSYQQLYSSSSFSGPVTINSVGFATISNVGITSSETISIGFSTTSATLTSLSSNLAANRGANYTTVFTGSYTVVDGSGTGFDLVFNTSPFLYNPSSGNLLMDVTVTSNTSGGFNYFEATDAHVTSQAFDLGNTTEVNADFGLVTQFGVTPGVVPEPGSIGLLAIGLVGGLGTALRRGMKSRVGCVESSKTHRS